MSFTRSFYKAIKNPQDIELVVKSLKRCFLWSNQTAHEEFFRARNNTLAAGFQEIVKKRFAPLLSSGHKSPFFETFLSSTY
jgi:hypothetical protein